jgi:hypothetical protein
VVSYEHNIERSTKGRQNPNQLVGVPHVVLIAKGDERATGRSGRCQKVITIANPFSVNYPDGKGTSLGKVTYNRDGRVGRASVSNNKFVRSDLLVSQALKLFG